MMFGDELNYLLLAVLGYAAFVFNMEEEEEQENNNTGRSDIVTGVAESVATLVFSLKGQQDQNQQNDDNGRPQKKRSVIKWNHKRGKGCVEDDYMGPVPLFSDRQFERVFRITRAFADRLLSELAAVENLFYSTT